MNFPVCLLIGCYFVDVSICCADDRRDHPQYQEDAVHPVFSIADGLQGMAKFSKVHLNLSMFSIAHERRGNLNFHKNKNKNKIESIDLFSE